MKEYEKHPREALALAKKYRKEGKYQEALEMHEWFHFNALSIRRSLYGVRLSFALADWVKLAEKYPKAKQRLIKIRNNGVRRIKGKKWSAEDFHDVFAISRSLKEEAIAIDIFKFIDKTESDHKKVNKCFDVVFEDLVSRGEVSLYNKWLIDPVAKIKVYSDEFKPTCEFLKRTKKEDMIPRVQRLFTDKIKLIIKALKMAKRVEDLAKLKKITQMIIPEEDYKKLFE